MSGHDSNVVAGSSSLSTSMNSAIPEEASCPEGSLLDEPDIRFPLMFAYIVVFLICLLGNTFTITVICVHRSMRTATNFFLANLALADMLVAVFCVLQNAFHILGSYNGVWLLGSTVCSLYVFFLHMVPCTSIGILVCVSLEKYVAVLHPLLALKLLTPKLRVGMALAVWCASVVFNLPYYYTTKEMRWGRYSACARDPTLSVWSLNTRELITLSFVIWYCVPLTTICYLYTRIGMVLWAGTAKVQRVAMAGSGTFEPSTPTVRYYAHTVAGGGGLSGGSGHASPIPAADAASTMNTSSSNGGGGGVDIAMAIAPMGSCCPPAGNFAAEKPRASTVPMRQMQTATASSPPIIPNNNANNYHHHHHHHPASATQSTTALNFCAGYNSNHTNGTAGTTTTSYYNGGGGGGGGGGGSDVLESRKKIVRLLIAIVCSFATLTLPNHLRLLHSSWSSTQLCNSTYAALLQPLAYLLLFLSSGVNPLLYAFMSQRFRAAVSDMARCDTAKMWRKCTRTRTLQSEVQQDALSRSPSANPLLATSIATAATGTAAAVGTTVGGTMMVATTSTADGATVTTLTSVVGHHSTLSSVGRSKPNGVGLYLNNSHAMPTGSSGGGGGASLLHPLYHYRRMGESKPRGKTRKMVELVGEIKSRRSSRKAANAWGGELLGLTNEAVLGRDTPLSSCTPLTQSRTCSVGSSSGYEAAAVAVTNNNSNQPLTSESAGGGLCGKRWRRTMGEDGKEWLRVEVELEERRRRKNEDGEEEIASASRSDGEEEDECESSMNSNNAAIGEHHHLHPNCYNSCSYMEGEGRARRSATVGNDEPLTAVVDGSGGGKGSDEPLGRAHHYSC